MNDIALDLGTSMTLIYELGKGIVIAGDIKMINKYGWRLANDVKFKRSQKNHQF